MSQLTYINIFPKAEFTVSKTNVTLEVAWAVWSYTHVWTRGTKK